MRFKRGLTASLGLILAVAGICSAAPSENRQSRPDHWRLDWNAQNARTPVNGSTTGITLDDDGDLKPGRHAVQDLGESTSAWREIHAVALIISSGVLNVHETFVDLTSGSLRGGVPTGGILIPTTTLITTLVNSPSTYIDMNITQPTGVPRNLVCFSSANILVTTTTLMMSATFYGYNGKGEYVSENIIFSTNITILSTTTTVYSTEVARAVGVGNVAFAYISSFTVQITSMSDVFGESVELPRMYIGFGQKIGLANNITATTDIYKITQSGGMDSTNTTLNPLIYIDTAQDYIVFSPLPNNADEKGLWYKVKRSN